MFLHTAAECMEKKLFSKNGKKKWRNGNVGKDNKRDREVSIFILFHIIKWLGRRNCLILMKFLLIQQVIIEGNEYGK